MSLDKAIKHGKEKRKPYYRSQRFDKTCRCNGGCPYCFDNRFHYKKIADEKLQQELDELQYEEEEDEND